MINPDCSLCKGNPQWHHSCSCNGPYYALDEAADERSTDRIFKEMWDRAEKRLKERKDAQLRKEESKD